MAILRLFVFSIKVTEGGKIKKLFEPKHKMVRAVHLLID